MNTTLRKLVLPGSMALCIATVSSSSRADDDETCGHTETHTEQHDAQWYGWETLIADVPMITTYALEDGIGRNSNSFAPIVLTDLLGYLIVSPVIHSLHHSGARGAASFGLHLGIPLLGALLGFNFGGVFASPCSQTDWFCGLNASFNGMAAGLGVGMGVATAIDSLALAWDHSPLSHERTSSNTSRVKQMSWSLTPTMNTRGGGLSVHGVF